MGTLFCSAVSGAWGHAASELPAVPPVIVGAARRRHDVRRTTLPEPGLDLRPQIAGKGAEGNRRRDLVLVGAALADAERREGDRGRADQRQRDDQHGEAPPGSHVVEATAWVVVRCAVGDASRPVTPRRLVLLTLVFALLVTSAVTVPRLSARAQTGDQDLVNLACSVPHEFLLRTWRGWRPDRGAQLSYIPQEPNFVGSGFPHVGPWDYVEDVPMLWYGPGFVPAGKTVKRPVTLAGIAPTVAKILHFDGFHPIDGQPMNEAILPDRQAAEARGHDGVGRGRHERARRVARLRSRTSIR